MVLLGRWELVVEEIKGGKPSTLRDHRLLLAEPGTAYRSGSGVSSGRVVAALGDRPAREVTTGDIEDLLRSVAATGVAPRTVNKVRQLVCAIFNYGMRPSTYGLPFNPATHADRRTEPERAVIAFYSPEQIEMLARSLAVGAHRDPSRPALGDGEIEARAREDVQDAELVRVAAYAGLRRGELVALHWRDVDFAGHKLVIRRSLSGDIEVKSTKSRRVREVPLSDQAAVALERLGRRGEFTGPDDHVFCSRLGRRLDPSALRRRYERARAAAGLESLRFHDLHHTYGSLLVAGGIDLVSVKAAMGQLADHDDRALPPRPPSRRAGRTFQPRSRGVDDHGGDGRVSKPELPRTARDPDGRSVEFSESSWRHIMMERPQLLDDVDAVLAAVASPDYREEDPIAGRERFYQQRVTDKVRWLRVVVDFSRTPAVVVTAFIQRKNPARDQ